MADEPKLERRTVIPAASNDTMILERMIVVLGPGETVEYDAMSKAIGRDVRSSAAGVLRTAMRRALRDHGIVVEAVRNVGLRRVVGNELISAQRCGVDRIRREARRRVEKLSKLDVGSLSNPEKVSATAMASMFGAFEITVPSFLLNKFGAAREGVIGSLVMGLTVGVIIAPCAAGIIIGLVTLVARMGLVVKGGLLFFAMGLGLGLPYLVLAVFSGLLQRLPQSGEWMVWIKKLFGFLLLGVAFYFLAPQVERIGNKFLFLAGITGLVGGLLLGWFDHTAGGGRGFKLFKQIVAVLFLILGSVWIHHSLQEKTNELSWNYYSGQSMEEILASGKPIFVDFYADWCAPCKQLDRETFSDSRVQVKSEAFYLLKVDCTKPDAATRAFMSLHQVTGMPTLIFIRPDGQEITELREIGYIDADRFLANLEKAL